MKSAVLDRPCQTIPDEIEFMYRLGYDYIKVQPGINFELNLPHTGRGVVGQAGDRAGVRAWAQGKSGVIQNWDDFERFNWPEKSDIDFSRFETIIKLLPEGMGVIGQYGDIFTLAWELMGLEKFAVAVYEETGLVQAIIDRLADLILYMFETMAGIDGVGILWYSDDIAYHSGPMISPLLLHRYLFPHLHHIAALCHARNIPFIYHSDGNLWPLMDDILACGVNALHPIEPESMDIEEVAGKYGDRLSLCGGIQVDLLSRGSPQRVVDLVRKMKDSLKGKCSWCAGSSNSIPEYISIDNYLAMVQTILED
jgi:uroporphyrinogen decarboxylase